MKKRLILMCPVGERMSEEDQAAIAERLAIAGITLHQQRSYYFDIEGSPQAIAAVHSGLPGWQLLTLKSSVRR